MGGVDVLTIMEAAMIDAARDGRTEVAGRMVAAKAAVAELIEADKEYDAAEVAWDALDLRCGIGDDRDSRDYESDEYQRVVRAISRRATALRNVQGGA